MCHRLSIHHPATPGCNHGGRRTRHCLGGLPLRQSERGLTMHAEYLRYGSPKRTFYLRIQIDESARHPRRYRPANATLTHAWQANKDHVHPQMRAPMRAQMR